MGYDPRGVQAFFDQYGTREWERLERTLQGRIRYTIHKRFLDEFAPDGARVLDAGCGPGRFALDLARRGARLTLVDISQTQLDLARQNLASAGLLDQVEAFHRLDMVDLGALPGDSFDVVMCYGGGLSYTCEKHEVALAELVRVLKPGGCLLCSVGSLYGTLRLVGPYDGLTFLESPDAHVEWQAVLAGAGVVYTRPGSGEFRQPWVLFTSEGLRQLLEKAGLSVVAMAASNPLVSEGAQIPNITDNPAASAALTALELALCDQPGLVDSGEHLLVVAQKP